MDTKPIQNPIARAIANTKASHTDPSGSYTGKPLYPRETPVQDADDL